MHEAWALSLCASRGYGLLTRSPQLVRAASDAYVTTHGTLWLLDHLVVAGCLSPPEAVAAVRRLQSSGRGFTQVECDKFTDRWDTSEPS